MMETQCRDGVVIYDGYKLDAVKCDSMDDTEIAAKTKEARWALRRVVCTLWPDAKWCGNSWLVAGDHVAEIRAADIAYPRGVPTHTLERAEALVGAILDYRQDPARHYLIELRYWRIAPQPDWLRQRMVSRIRAAALLDGLRLEDETR